MPFMKQICINASAMQILCIGQPWIIADEMSSAIVSRTVDHERQVSTPGGVQSYLQARH